MTVILNERSESGPPATGLSRLDEESKNLRLLFAQPHDK